MPSCPDVTAQLFAQPLNEGMLEYEINTSRRASCFLGQVAHESMQLRRMREIWGPTPAQGRYEGRHDLGNIMAGDGERFMGRGLIQITGRANYKLCSLALFNDERLLTTPHLLEEPQGACRSAGWFWKSRGLNALADDGDFSRITLRVNGSLRTLSERQAFRSAATRAFV